ncbi:DUF2834 domain-containing protein [Roseobacter sp. HKCCA0434]|uniref:DUF2834 domain-containing protein n=1 Tax=Roseobacter sp. HKCCA0434 TaxID=3079297 RepID=UPI002905F2E3|nr:DUF2834 domain-containing protein [Roseobacter sp. HKCCA0434]
MSRLRLTYLILAVIGAVLPMAYFLPWLAENDWSMVAMVGAWNVSDATTGLVYDLTVAATALTIWIVAEVRVRRDWSSLWAIPATFCIGLSCGLPLYLFLRSRNQG